MGNIQTHQTSLASTVMEKPFFLVERILAPNAKVGLVSGAAVGQQSQGIRIGDGEIQRLKCVEVTPYRYYGNWQGGNSLHYTFEGGTTLDVYDCGTLPYYSLRGDDINTPIYYSKLPRFKSISMGDATKEIDMLAQCHKSDEN